MLNKKLYIAIAIVIVGGFSLAITFNGSKKSETSMFTLFTPPVGDNYEELWAEVVEFERKGLYESALKKVEDIYNKAYVSSNSSQIVKCTIYKIKYNQYMAEDDYVIAIDNLNKLVEESSSPQKEILHSLTAQVYWGYYENNRWKFSSRTNTVNFEQKDIRTWTLDKIVEHVGYHFDQSLKNENQTKILDIKSYKDIIIDGVNSEELRPTLYDFLAHRALDFYKNTEPEITKPAYAFKLDQKEIFNSANAFVAFKLVDRDTESTKRKAFELFQKLIDFHLNSTKNELALIDIDLERLEFAKSYSVLEEKDSLYFFALNQLADKHINSKGFAEINYYRANYLNIEGSKYNPSLKDDLKNDEYKWAKKKAIGYCLEAIQKFPDSYGAKLCENLRNTILAKHISFQTDQVVIPNEPFKASLSFKNINKVFAKIIKVEYNKVYDKEFDNDKKRIDYYNSLSPTHTWEINLKADEDYNNRLADIDIPALDLGYYIVVLGSDKNFSYDTNSVNYTFLWSSNISFSSRENDNNEVEFYVLHRKTGHPLNKVKGHAYYEKYNYVTRKYIKKSIGTYTSDQEGYFKIPASSEYRSIYVDFELGKDELKLNSSYYQNGRYKKSNEVYPQGALFIDRGIYRPGQKLFFKGLVFENNDNNAKVLANEEVQIQFYDANYQVIETKKIKTNEYGTVSGEFITPENGMNGQMHLQMSIRNGKNYLQTKYFRVEEYKRPNFEVSFNPIQGSYKINQTVKVQGLAQAFAGNVIDGAEVKYHVTRTASFPWWCWYYWRYTPNSNYMEITSGTTTTDENGNFEVLFQAIPDESVNKKYQPTYYYSITADVTDINGETRSSSTSVAVGYHSLMLSIGIGNEIEKNESNEFIISSTNLNGEKVTSEGTITLYKLGQKEKLVRDRKFSSPNHFLISKADHDKLYPFDEYDNLEADGIEKNKTKLKEYSYSASDKKEDTTKFKLDKLNDLEPGSYQLEIKSKDEFGTPVSQINNFIVYSKTSNKTPVKEFKWVKQLGYTFKPGEKAQFLIASSAKDVKVLYEIELKNKIISKQWITLNNEQKLIEVPVLESYRGNFSVHFSFIKENRSYLTNFTVTVPFSNKELDVSFETFRDKLYPGQKEKWKVNIKGKNGDKVAAEMLATLYDASLDEFSYNSFYLNVYQSYYSRLSWNSYNGGFGNTYNATVSYLWNPYNYFYDTRTYNTLNLFGAYFGGYYHYGRYRSDLDYGATTYAYDAISESEDYKEEVSNETRSTGKNIKQRLAHAETASTPDYYNIPSKNAQNGEKTKDELGESGGEMNGRILAGGGKKQDLTEVKARTNFNETAFFFPELRTNEKGEISFEFEIPEALTKWKFLSMAHTKDMKLGFLTDEVVTQKDLMVVPNSPRFLREGDKITLSTKISNISKKDLAGEVQLFLFDAQTMKPIDVQLMNTNAKKEFSSKAGQSTNASWDLEIPFGYQSIVYKIVAAANNFSDGEQKPLPVLTNRMLVTEPMPMPIKKKGEKVFKFEKLLNTSTSTTLKHHKLTLEYTNNPAWYVVQAMPYMMEYPYECAEQTFTRFYANSLATHIMNSNPKIKTIIEAWKDLSPDEFLSNLEKNEELKAVVLEETPWVLDAKDESARKKRISQLLDLNKMTKELDKSLTKLRKMQVSNGGWPWFKGGEESRYITQHIVTGMGHLDNLGVKNVRDENKTWSMVQSAIRYLDIRITEDFADIKKYDKDWEKNKHLSNIQIQYLYSRTFFNDVTMNGSVKEAYQYFLKQSKKYWLDFNNYTQGMIALANYRDPSPKTGIHIENEIMASLKERAIKNEELGMYWKGMMDGGYYWYEAPIETQALMIEAFQTVSQDQETVEELKVWLLKQKQTTEWKTTKSTAEACYALLLNGTDLLANDEMAEIEVGKYKIDYSGKPSSDNYVKSVKPNPGTGYFKTSWGSDEITADMGKVTIRKKEDGVSWGALYWQYFENLDKITTHETPLKLSKKLFKEKITDKGKVLDPISESNVLAIGDKVVVRIELRVDRNMEFVHMKDMRASGFEPINILSKYKWQDGLGYYESTKDASTNFFFDNLPRGTYVFEYPLRVSQKGDFSNGITSIQCMYAPEFASHSEGIRIKVK